MSYLSVSFLIKYSYYMNGNLNVYLNIFVIIVQCFQTVLSPCYQPPNKRNSKVSHKILASIELLAASDWLVFFELFQWRVKGVRWMGVVKLCTSDSVYKNIFFTLKEILFYTLVFNTLRLDRTFCKSHWGWISHILILMWGVHLGLPILYKDAT